MCASKFTLLDDPSFIFMMNSRYQYGYRSIHIPIGRYSQHLGSSSISNHKFLLRCGPEKAVVLNGPGLKVPDPWARLGWFLVPAVSFMCFGSFGPFREVSPFLLLTPLPGPTFPILVCLRNSGSSPYFLSLEGFRGCVVRGKKGGKCKEANGKANSKKKKKEYSSKNR